LRLAIVSDLHLTERPARADVSLEEQAKILDEIAWTIEEEDVDAAMILGDVYDGRSTAAERAVALRWFARLANYVPVDVIRGNHDDALDIEALGMLKNVTSWTIPGERVSVVNAARFCFAPWPKFHIEGASSAFADVVRGLAAGAAPGRKDYLFAHCDLVGAKLDGGQDTAGRVQSVLTADDLHGWDGVFLGHYHKRQEFYPGSIRPMHFGDDNAKGFGIYDASTGETEWFGPFGRELITSNWTWYQGKLGSNDPNYSAAPINSLIRIRYEVPEAEREAAAAAALEIARKDPRIVFEPIVTVDTRTRGAEVAAAVSPWEKLVAFWGDAQPARAKEIKAKMEALR
jgi:DNA repair exonuclease SbcCD nuclease subunit